MLSERSDEELVRACLAGDQSAWEALIGRYQRLIYSVPLRMGLSLDEAADVFQLTCLRLFQRLDTLREPERIAGWLASTARRLSLDHHARRQPIVAVDEAALTERPHPGLPPDEDVLLLEEEQRIRAAVEQLPPRCRELLQELFYGEGDPSYAEVARRLGLSIGSVGPIRQRCFARLRALLA